MPQQLVRHEMFSWALLCEGGSEANVSSGSLHAIELIHGEEALPSFNHWKMAKWMPTNSPYLDILHKFRCSSMVKHLLGRHQIGASTWNTLDQRLCYALV